ncbi:hypothetical protein MMC25_002102 [Agyrium rufum]|nr:hypothetical protein [Agyrium rufum]
MLSSLHLTILSLLLIAPTLIGSAVLPSRPFEHIKLQASTSNDNLTVDLGYAVYQGVANSSTGLNTWKGVRFAAPPVGSLRWQVPQLPSSDRSVQQAIDFDFHCPQNFDSPGPTDYIATPASDDCLFLNVYAPSNAVNLPVFVWIHGGGHGAGDGTTDMLPIINSYDESFVAITIQYRLGAFGFLSSDKVYRNGVVNAGLLDQHFALQWVQAYISQFGGDPTQVTIAGESEGGGSVMLQDMAYGGTLGTSLFVNGFLPVTDGIFIQQLLAQQLLKKQVLRLRMLAGNLNTTDALVSWLQLTFPLFTTEDIAKILLYYPASNVTDPNAVDFATNGLTGATALNESQTATGSQQRADKIYAETTFVCPSYWLVEAYSGSRSRASYKYQYSVPISTHGADVSGYFGPAAPFQGPDFEMAFTPIANGASPNNTSTTNPASDWPLFSAANPYQLNLNETGGVAISIPLGVGLPNVTEFTGPGLMNDFSSVNAYTWEGGRGVRCDFWRSMGAIVPE